MYNEFIKLYTIIIYIINNIKLSKQTKEIILSLVEEILTIFNIQYN